MNKITEQSAIFHALIYETSHWKTWEMATLLPVHT